jgi:hypothetical protein
MVLIYAVPIKVIIPFPLHESDSTTTRPMHEDNLVASMASTVVGEDGGNVRYVAYVAPCKALGCQRQDFCPGKRLVLAYMHGALPRITFSMLGLPRPLRIGKYIGSMVGEASGAVKKLIRPRVVSVHLGGTVSSMPSVEAIEAEPIFIEKAS